MTDIANLGFGIDSSPADRATKSLDRLASAAQKTETATERMSRENEQAVRQMRSMDTATGQLFTSLQRIAGIAAGVFGGIKLTGLIKDVTMANSRFEQLGLVMEVVGRNVSLSQDQVHRYAKEVEAMGISMTESRQTVISMASAQMDLAKASELARLAQDAAVIANTNSSDALGRLIYGLQSGQTQVLKTMGLNVNFEKSYRDLATQLGKTSDEMTEQERVQARTNAVMESAIQISGSYEASMESAAKQVGSTTRYLQDLGVMWGEVFSEAGREAIFGYSDALKGMHATTKQMREDGTLESISKAIGALARGLVTAAKVAGTFAIAMYAIPALQGAWSLALAAKTAALKLFTAQVVTATGALGLLQRSLMVVAAAFAGWQIGTYLRSEFEIVEKAGIALMGGMHRIAIHIGGFFGRLGEEMKFALTNPLSAFRNELADVLQWVTGLHRGALKLLGLDGLAESLSSGIEKIRTTTGEEHKALLEQMKLETRREADAVSDIYAEMFANVGKSAGANLKVVGKGLDDVLDRLGGFNDELKKTEGGTGGIKKVDTAFQSLYDSLFPAEAAQRKYNEQIALLSKHLSGDRLAKAVDRLNESLADGDHTGPADAIAAYIKELQDLEDKINPAGRAAREFREEQAKLRAEIERSGDPTGEYAALLADLERQYEENSRVTTQWAQWTESALERVDSAFADAWRNIGDGFSSFRDNLTNAFKQMLAELAHMAITKPIILELGAMMGVGQGAQGNTGIWGMLGGGGNQGGIGNLATMGKNLYSIYSGITGVGQAVLTGWQSGGISGAISGGAGYYGNLASSAINSISGMFGGQVAGAVGGQVAGTAGGAAASAGYGIGQSLVTGQVGSAAYAGASAGATAAAGGGGFLSSMGAMATNPVGWITAAALSAYSGFNSYKDGMRPDADSTRSHGGAWATGYQPLIEYYGAINKLTDAIGLGGTFLGSIINAPGTFWQSIGGALFGSGEQFKRTVGSAQGVYSGGEYTGMGTVDSFYGGSRKFGDDFDGALHDLADVFSRSLGGLFDMFGIDSDIETEVTGRLRRTSGKLAADLYVSFEDQMVHVFGQYAKKGRIGEGMEAFFDDVMGRGLVEAIAASSLPEYLKELTAGLKEAEEVGDAISGLITRFTAVNEVIELVNVSAFGMTDAGLRGADALIAMSGGIESLLSSTATYYDQFFSAAEKQADTVAAVQKAFEAADITLADSRESYRAMVEDIDVTTEAGQQMFAAMMGLAGQASEYYSIIEQEAAQAAAMEEARAAQLLAGVGTFYDHFTSETEKADHQLDGITKQFRAMGLSLTTTREGWRKLVEGLNTSHEIGQKNFEAYVSMAGAANTYFDIMETRQAQARAAELARFDEIKRAADGVSSSLSGFRETLILDQLGDPDAQYGYFKAQADGMARLAGTLTDPQAIAEAARDASGFAARAYGLLDDEQKNQMGGEMLDFVNRLESMSHQRIEQSEQRSAEITAEATAEAVGREVGRIADAIISHLDRSGEGTKELVSAIRAVASHTGSQYAPQYEEVNA